MDSIGTLIEGFLVRYSASTARAYGEDLSLYLKYSEEAGVDPLDADRPHIDGFARWQEERGNRPSTIARRMSAIRQFYKVLHRDGVLTSDPARDAVVPRVYRDRSESLYIDAEAMRAFIEAAREESPDVYVLITLMLGLGLRVSEACSTNVEQFRSETLPIKGKGGRHEAMPLPPEIVKVVMSTGRDSGPVAVRKDGNRMDRRTAYRLVKKVAAKAGVEDASPHDLRAAYITAALDEGLDIYKVQDMARHASPATTELYDRARRRRMNDGNAVVAGLLGL